VDGHRSNDDYRAAHEVFRLDEIEPTGRKKLMALAGLAVSVALQSAGPISRPGARRYAITCIDSGEVLCEEDESLSWDLDVRSLIEHDLRSMTASAFAARWGVTTS
jgi:hypothetical protein